MPERSSFEYCVIRVVPRVERQEFVNAGVVLHCKRKHYLDARLDFELNRLAAFEPGCSLEIARSHLRGIMTICAGGEEAKPLGDVSKPERFRWIAAASSTMIQASPVHCGVCENPEQALDELYERLVG